MRNLSLILIFSCLLSACSNAIATPDPYAIQTAVAQTIAAKPTETFLPTETPEPSTTPSPAPTETNTPLPTATSTDTPSPTPDLRVIDADPYTFLLKAEDLPKEAYYYLPGPGWISPHRNFEVVKGKSAEESRAYLDATGRVDGWVVYYYLGSTTVVAPVMIYNNPVLFRTAAGAQLLFTQYGNCSSGDDYVPVQTDFKIGDLTNVCIRREMRSGGDYNVMLMIEFSYRNVAHSVAGYGLESEVKLEYIADIAKTLFAKLEAMPLSDSVTFKP